MNHYRIPLERLVRYVVPEELFQRLIVQQVSVGPCHLLSAAAPVEYIAAVNDALLTARSGNGMLRNDRIHFGFSGPFFHFLVSNHLQANAESWKRFYVRIIDQSQYGDDVVVAKKKGAWQFYNEQLMILVEPNQEIVVELVCPLELPPAPEPRDEDLFMTLPVMGAWPVGEA